jgi:hypothetical protein
LQAAAFLAALRAFLCFFLQALARFAFELATWAESLAPSAGADTASKHAHRNATTKPLANVRPPGRDIDGNATAALPSAHQYLSTWAARTFPDRSVLSRLSGAGSRVGHGRPDANEFCIVLTPGQSAPASASEAIRRHFGALAEEIRSNLAALVGELVERSVERRPRSPITVMAVLGTDAIRGEVSDPGDLVSFEVPLAG